MVEIETTSDPLLFHRPALSEGQSQGERVAGRLSDVAVEDVFPKLVRAIAAAAPAAPLPMVREAALKLLYRLLFIFHAEDRNLLPKRDRGDGAFCSNLRGSIDERNTKSETFSGHATRYWMIIEGLSRTIDRGHGSIGLVPYEGSLFDQDQTLLLTKIRLCDAIMADVIDALSFERTGIGRGVIDYRNLSVRHLGSIYERLLGYDVIRQHGEVLVRGNIFARTGSGSYYTSEELVGLIIRETVAPLIADLVSIFATRAVEQRASAAPLDQRLAALTQADPAEGILGLKICDPAMGCGNFLVPLVDYLADRVLDAMAEAEAAIPWASYVSPLADRIEAIRTTILGNAEDHGWPVAPEQLDDRHIVRRMIAKRCVYGVDKDPMAVELAKVALWLHTATVGTPFVFLDHHLRCGDSLFGLSVKKGFEKATRIQRGLEERAAESHPPCLHEPLTQALRAASFVGIIEGLNDAESAEARRSAEMFDGVKDMTAPLAAILSVLHAWDWQEIDDQTNRDLLQAYLSGVFGDPIQIALGRLAPLPPPDTAQRITADASAFGALLAKTRALIDDERFLHWEVAFPEVWSKWFGDELSEGFDAIIGNPPWDRMKLQKVEWFAARQHDIALAPRAADRKRMIDALTTKRDPLALDYAKAAGRADAGVRMARNDGDYPLLSGGDLNIYSLFIERATTLVKRDGIIGLLTPSGVASDKTAASFFKGIATGGHLKCLFDFENRRTRYGRPPFFPEIDSRFKFSAIVFSPARRFEAARCAFFLQDLSELDDPDRCFPLTAADFARVNPNTGTTPTFRTKRDAALITAIHSRLPILVDRTRRTPTQAWPVRYSTMFHMTNDSHLFRTRAELEETDHAHPIGGSRSMSAGGEWLPLYVGRMVRQFDHRAASVETNDANVHNAAISEGITSHQKTDPSFSPTPQYWVKASDARFPDGYAWSIAFRDIARATDTRTIIASIVPKAAFGNKLPLLLPTAETYREDAALIVANLNARVFDFVARSKIHSTSVNWYLVEQLPVVPLDRYAAKTFGTTSAAQIVREAVLELTYTANDMAEFARDMGYVDRRKKVKPPFKWDADRRLRLRAKLDAVFFHLYGITDPDDVRHVYSTFPIGQRAEIAAHGRHLSLDLCLAHMNAIAAGDPDAGI